MSFALSVKRQDNRRRVLDALRLNGPASRASLARLLGLSKATLSAIASEALEAGWLLEQESRAGGVGRRPTLLSLTPALGVVAAVDINVKSIAVSVADLRGKTLSEITRPAPDNAGALQALVQNVLVSACSDLDRATPLLRAVTLSLPAAIDEQGRLNAVGQPSCLVEIDWYSALDARFPGVLVRLVNNSDAAALAEHAQGIATDWSSFAYIGVGQSGLGVGLVLGGELYTGSRFGAGQIGALALGNDEQPLDGLAWLPRTATFYWQLARLVMLVDHLLDLDGVVVHAVDLDYATWIGELPAMMEGHALRRIALRPAALHGQAPLVGAVRLACETGWADMLQQIASGR